MQQSAPPLPSEQVLVRMILFPKPAKYSQRLRQYVRHLRPGMTCREQINIMKSSLKIKVSFGLFFVLFITILVIKDNAEANERTAIAAVSSLAHDLVDYSKFKSKVDFSTSDIQEFCAMTGYRLTKESTAGVRLIWVLPEKILIYAKSGPAEHARLINLKSNRNEIVNVFEYKELIQFTPPAFCIQKNP